MISFLLLIVGGLNWLLVGLGAGDLVAILFGAGSILARIVYVLVGVSAIVLLATHKKDCKMCKVSGAQPTSM